MRHIDLQTSSRLAGENQQREQNGRTGVCSGALGLRVEIKKQNAVRPSPNGKAQQNQRASEPKKHRGSAPICGPAEVLAIELLAGRWRRVVSADGVVAYVASRKVRVRS